MPISKDLSNLVEKFKGINPNSSSLNEKLEKIPKRTRFQNFVGFLIYVLTFSLRSKNPQLDQAAKKSMAFAQPIFKQPITAEEKTALINTFTKLKTIVEKNGGGEKGKILALIKKMQLLKTVVSPLQPVPEPDKLPEVPKPVLPREPNLTEIKLTKCLETSSGIEEIRSHIREVEKLAPSSKKSAELYENLFRAYSQNSGYLIEDFSHLKPEFFKTFLENLLASPNPYNSTWVDLMSGLLKIPNNHPHAKVFVEAFPSHQALPSVADMNYRQRIAMVPPTGTLATHILNSDEFKKLLDHLEENERLTLLQNLVPYAARSATGEIAKEPPIKQLFDLPNRFPAYRRVILEGLSQTTNGANLCHLLLQDGFDPDWVKRVMVNNPPDKLERCVDTADKQEFGKDSDPFFRMCLPLFGETPVKKELEQRLIAELQPAQIDRLFDYLKGRSPSHMANRFEWLPPLKNNLHTDQLIGLAKVLMGSAAPDAQQNLKAVREAFIQSPQLCKDSLHEATLWKLFEEHNSDIQAKVIRSVFGMRLKADKDKLLTRLKALPDAWRKAGLKWEFFEDDNLAIIAACSPRIICCFLNGISENRDKECKRDLIVKTLLKPLLEAGGDPTFLLELSPEVIGLFDWSLSKKIGDFLTKVLGAESERDFYFCRIVQTLQKPQEPKERALLLKISEALLARAPEKFHFFLNSLSKPQVEQLSQAASENVMGTFFFLLLADKVDQAQPIAERFTAAQAAVAETICKKAGKIYFERLLKLFNPAQVKLSPFGEVLGREFIAKATDAKELLKLPRSFLISNLRKVVNTKTQIDLLNLLPDGEALQALDAWWDQMGPLMADRKNGELHIFPFGKMIRLSDDPFKISTLASFNGGVAQQFIGTPQEYRIHDLLKPLEETPWKFWMALPGLEFNSFKKWKGKTAYPTFSSNLDLFDKSGTKFKEIAKFSQALTSYANMGRWKEAREYFETANEPIKLLLLAPILGTSLNTLAKNLNALPEEKRAVAFVHQEARQKLIQVLLTGRGPFLGEFPDDFLEELRIAANPWLFVYLNPTAPYADLKLKVEGKEIPIDRVMLNIDENLKSCFDQKGDTFTAKPDKAIEAEMRLDWLYGRLSPSKLLEVQGQKFLFENQQKPLSLTSLFNDAASSDIILKVGDKVIHAHKCILDSLRYFEDLFTLGKRDAKETMELKNISYDQLLAVIRTVYEGKLPEFEKVKEQNEFYALFKFLQTGTA